MKPVDCDQVFEILTSGPFPTGGPHDDAVESHLSACDGCRRLAEALAPALDLIHESLRADEAAGLPEYWGEHSGMLVDVRRDSPAASASPSSAAEALRAEMIAAQAAVATTRPVAPPEPVVARRLSPAFAPWLALAGVALVAVFVGRWSVGALAPLPARPTIASSAVAAPAGVDWNAFGLAVDCLEPRAARTVSTGEPASFEPRGPLVAHVSGDVRCCTHCHAAGKEAVARAPSKLLLAQACVLCHLSVQ